MKPIIILINGFASSKLWWQYTYENSATLRKLDFLDNLKKLGTVYTFNQPFFNIDYYGTPDKKSEILIWKKIYKKYKPCSSNINFTLEDLDYHNICNKIYNNVKAKYGNQKYIVIGHSYGGTLALVFSKMFSSDCLFCCCIDNPPHVLEFYKIKNNREDLSVIDEYPDTASLKNTLSIIKNSTDQKERNKYIDKIYALITVKSCQDRIKYYDKKLYTPTIIFRATIINPKGWQIYFNKYSKKEHLILKKNKNLIDYVYMKGADHYIWKNQELSDQIIDKIKWILSSYEK